MILFRIKGFLATVLLILSTGMVYSQPQLTTPRPSQRAAASQTIGVTDIDISYHRPGVKGRAIWGSLVPYDQVWRAGANENTTISFSGPVKIEGGELAAGTYGLHMIPSRDSWTIIFSNVSWAWGSFSYDENEDALRVTVIPEEAPFQERLSYRFDDPEDQSVVVALYWEKLRVPFRINVDVPAAVVASMRKELRGLPRFFWQGWSQAANYCLQNNVNLAEAMEWIDRSIDLNENFTNLRIKAELLKRAGQDSEGESLQKRAMTLATEAEMNTYGYQLMNGGKVNEAIAVFKKNVKDHPDSWNVYDSLGEALAKSGDKKQAITNYARALKMVKDENQKVRIQNILNQLKGLQSE